MAINKVINKSTKSHGAMKNVIKYVLQDEKVHEGYVAITGPYAFDEITPENVYNAFLDEKKLWNKDSGRMYSHNVISFHKDENITPEQCLEIAQSFADKFFKEHQCLITIHQDRDHLHIHIVTNTVSFIDGMKLHQTKKDLEIQKSFTNHLCMERGLSVAKKGLHFDGSRIEEGTIIAWAKDKYHLMVNNAKKSYVTECAIAVLESKENCCSVDDFIAAMEERGWHTTWTDEKKHITFNNENGDKVRDSNISKTFNMNISKEALYGEFERQNAIRLERTNRIRQQQEDAIKQSLIAREIEQRESEATLQKSEFDRRSSESERKARDNSRLRQDYDRYREEISCNNGGGIEVRPERKRFIQQGISLTD